jgi:hypothetical protein
VDTVVEPHGLIEEHAVVDGASNTLDGGVGTKIKVILKRLCDARIL